MISAEAPILFAKACEMFIAEMTIKGYYNAEKCERKTLQRKDIATAIARTETYDFLIDTIPKNELLQHVPADSFVSTFPLIILTFYRRPIKTRCSTKIRNSIKNLTSP